MYIIGLNGSPNKDGGTIFLLNKVLDKCKQEGATTEIINISDCINSAKFPFCVVCSNPCSKACYKGTMLEEAFDKITKADAVVLGSPVYFGSVSAQFKAFFDKTRKIRGDKAWVSKICGCATTGASRFGGQEGTVNTMQNIALVQGMTIVGNGSMEFDAGHFGVCAVRPAESDEYAIAKCESLGSRLIEEINNKKA